MTGAPFRAPTQRRSAAAWSRVLAAGRAILEEDGYAGFTLPAVGTRAGVSMSSIYRRVDSKEQLFAVIHAEATAELVPRLVDAYADDDRWAGLTTADLVRNAVRVFADIPRTHAAFLRAVIQRSAEDADVRRRSHDVATAIAGGYRSRLATRREDVAHADPDLAIDVSFRVLWAAVVSRIAWDEDLELDVPLPWDRFIEELADVTAAYLLAPRVG
jgi:AcrR family transcriptional regulator